jgi:hypothetical protein
MNRVAKGCFNFVTLLFGVATVVVLGVFYAVATDAMDAPFLAAKATDAPATLFVPDTLTPTLTPTLTLTPLPTRTDTPTPTATLTPTFTPSPTDTPTITNTPTITLTITLSPTKTLIPPTPTPTRTPTPTITLTPTFTPSPTGPSPTPTNTLSPYPFRVQPSSLILRENYANAAGCNWQGIAGQVTTDRGDPVVGIQVRVRGDDIGDVATITGTNTFYGPSGWEVVIGSQTNNNRYQVALYAEGVQVSPTVEIVFPNLCQQNLATVNFIQTRPF